MRLLAVETSGSHGGIALADQGTVPLSGQGAVPLDFRVIVEVLLDEGLRHGRDLVPAIQAACERAAWDPRRIDVVAVSIGPGSFTGIRIAVTLAKFMAYDTGAKVVAVPSLRALAENAPADRPRVVPVIDAKRGGLFASIFDRRDEAPAHIDEPRARRDEAPAHIDEPRARRGSGGILAAFDETFGPALVEPEALAKRLSAPAFILGHGITKGRAALAAFDLAPPDLWDIRPSVVARLGAALAACGQFADPLRLEPLYIRRPEAEEIWERRRGGG
jgi:tRNA threonylcarbamoyladenosine biosynthesis protein TsaB